MKRGKASRYRRRYPIHAYVGENGSGKSLAAVVDSMASLSMGRPVLSTLRLVDWERGGDCTDDGCEFFRHPDHGPAHPLWIPFTNWGQLLDAHDCDVIMDEMAGVANARSSMALPVAIDVLAQQMRRRDVVVRWTAPNWRRADLVFREVTQAVTVCRGFLRKREKGSEAAWLPRRLFRWSTYDPRNLAEDGDPKEDAKKLFGSWFWGPGSDAFRAYDSLDDVQIVGTVTETGRCVVCGGTRRAPACTCGDRVRPAVVRKRGSGEIGGARLPALVPETEQDPTGTGGALLTLMTEVGGHGIDECSG